MPRVDVRVLGTFRVLVDGAERAIGARKQRSLIAALAFRDQPRSREQLIAELWPESDDDRGRESLRQALHRIRAAVGPELITSVHDDLRIHQAVAVDVRSFQHAVASGTDRDLEVAFSTYEGDLCVEAERPDAESERARLRGLFASAGESLAAERLSVDPLAAAEIARRIIEIDPYREEAHRALLRALAAAGDLPAATIHYRRLGTLLRDELGIEPSPETQQVYASLARQIPSAAAAKVRRPSLEPPPALVGRRDEYSRLMQLASGAIDGHGGAALVVGEPGAGKTRLLDEIATVAELHGLRVLRARVMAAEGVLPFQLWVEALAPCAVDALALPQPWPGVLATLIPELGAGEVGEVAPDLRRTRLFEGVARLLAHVAAGLPTVLLLDDLQNADPDSIHLWHYVARTSRQRRLAVIAAARPLLAGSPLTVAAASLETRGGVIRVPLGPLGPDAVAELIRAFQVDVTEAAWLAPPLARWTGGNPFFVLEALQALVTQERLRREGDAWSWSGPRPAEDEPLAPELPATARQSILGRLGALAAPARKVLELTAVLGSAAELGALVDVAGRDELSVAEDLAAAVEAGLVREAREGSLAKITFVHDLVRDATYQEIPLTMRAAIHRRIGATLERRRAAPGAIAYHLTAGGDALRAVDHWLASAAEAERRFAHEDAIRSYRAALEALGPSAARRAEILERIGDAKMKRGDMAAAAAIYEEALALTPDAAVDRRAVLGVRVAFAAGEDPRHPRAHRLATDAVHHYRQREDKAGLSEALVALASVHFGAGGSAAAHEAADEARVLARSVGIAATEAGAIRASIEARWLGGDVNAAPEPEDVERLAAQLQDHELSASLLGMLSMGQFRRGRPTESVATAQRSLDMARRVGSLDAQLRAGERLTHSLITTGKYRQAAEIAEQVLADVASLEPGARSVRGELAFALALSGESERARIIAQDVVRRPPGSPRPVHAMPTSMALRALLALGDPVSPETALAVRPTCLTCEIPWETVAGRVLARAGRIDDALSVADDLARHIGERGFELVAGAPDHIRAIAFALSGRAADARAAAARSRDHFRSVGHVQAEADLDRDLAGVSAVHA